MKKGTFLYTLSAFVLVSSTQLHAADDYLSSLESESNDTQMDTASAHADVIKTKKQKALAISSAADLPANLSKTDFKIFLMDNSFDSYMSYLELEQDKKDAVFQQYQKSQTPNVNIIEGLISRLSK